MDYQETKARRREVIARDWLGLPVRAFRVIMREYRKLPRELTTADWLAMDPQALCEKHRNAGASTAAALAAKRADVINNTP